MDYSDTTVLIPVKDEPAVAKVTSDVFKNLPGCKVIIIHKGPLGAKISRKNLVIMEQKSSGKGAACVQAVKHVNTKILCIIDGDDTYESRDLKKLVQLVRESADLALGNRFANIRPGAMPFYVRLGNHILTLSANLLYGMNIKDSQTGIRAMKKTTFDRLGIQETHFGFEEEMNIKAKQRGFKVVEIPTKYYIRTGSSKQFKLADGVKLFLINFKFLGKN